MEVEERQGWKRILDTGRMRKIFGLAWPSILENLATTITNIIDTVMVSPLGPAAVAAVGITIQPIFLFLSPIIAMYVAVAAIVARRKGEGKREEANRTVMSVLVFSLIIYLLIAIVINLYYDPLLRFMGSNPEIHDDAASYLRILLTGSVFNIMTMIINAGHSGSGNTRIAFISNLVSSVVNICCNYLLIQGHLGFPELGVTGAAIASITGQFFGFLVSLGSLFQHDSFIQIRYCVQKKIRPAFEALKAVASLAVNIFVENILMRVGFMVTAMQAASLGTEVFATHNVGMNLLNFGFSLASGMQTAAVASTGSALGAGKKRRAMDYGYTCLFIGVILSVFWFITLFFFGGAFFRITFSEASYIVRGIRISRYVMFIVFFQIISIVCAGALRAAGDVRYTLVVSTITITVIRSLVTVVLVQLFHMGIDGIWLGILAHQFSSAVLMMLRFHQGKWVNLKI